MPYISSFLSLGRIIHHFLSGQEPSYVENQKELSSVWGNVLAFDTRVISVIILKAWATINFRRYSSDNCSCIVTLKRWYNKERGCTCANMLPWKLSASCLSIIVMSYVYTSLFMCWHTGLKAAWCQRRAVHWYISELVTLSDAYKRIGVYFFLCICIQLRCSEICVSHPFVLYHKIASFAESPPCDEDQSGDLTSKPHPEAYW